jgi:hypothetical protein
MQSVPDGHRIDGAAGEDHGLVSRMSEVRRFAGASGLVIAVLLGACGGGSESVSTSTTGESFDTAAREYAISAERALAGTTFAQVGPQAIADLVVGLCEGFGIGAIPATIDGIGLAATVDDQEIIAEVLIVGVVQVCPDRAPVDFTGFYLDAVTGTVEAAGASGAFVEGDVVRAGPIVCDVLESQSGVEAALLATVESLFGVVADDVDSLKIDGNQGVVAGAVLASATAVLCPQYAAAVEGFMESL